MAYPGNVHALVARDQHLTCINGNDHVKENNDGTPTGKLSSDRGRRSRTKPRSDSEAVPQKLGLGPTLQAFRLGGSSSQVARGGRISPCDHGKMMDHGMFELRSELLRESPKVRARTEIDYGFYRFITKDTMCAARGMAGEDALYGIEFSSYPKFQISRFRDDTQVRRESR